MRGTDRRRPADRRPSLRVPASEPRRSAAFYEAVFGWTVDTDRVDPSLEDGMGHVIGHVMADLPVAGEAESRAAAARRD